MSKITVHRCDFCQGEMGKDESKHHTVSIDGGEKRDCCHRCHEWLFLTKHRMRASKKGKRARVVKAAVPTMSNQPEPNPVDAAMEQAKGVMRSKGERGDGTFSINNPQSQP